MGIVAPIRLRLVLFALINSGIFCPQNIDSSLQKSSLTPLAYKE